MLQCADSAGARVGRRAQNLLLSRERRRSARGGLAVTLLRGSAANQASHYSCPTSLPTNRVACPWSLGCLLENIYCSPAGSTCLKATFSIAAYRFQYRRDDIFHTLPTRETVDLKEMKEQLKKYKEKSELLQNHLRLN